MLKKIFSIAIATCIMNFSFGQGNNYVQDYTKFQNLALTPPMGWNSWNKFACNVNEEMIREMADAMVATGMKDAGYSFINIDDCWHGDRDSLGFIHPDSARFPSGIKALADYVHSKGLKLGIYSDAGSQTCGGRPGSRGYEFQDALMYAKWGVDYLKYDWCNTEGLKAEGAYKTITAAMKNAGKPIVLSICEWGTDSPWVWGQNVGHLWRTTGDIYNCFDCIEDHGTWKSFGVMQILDKQEGLRKYAGPGHWNDPDMLEIGNGALNEGEDRAHFTMWAMIAAPLIAGNDLRTMTPEVKAVLTNKNVIGINQDSLGVQGYKLNTTLAKGVDVWFKPLVNNEWAVCFLNRSVKDQKVQLNWASLDNIDSLSNKHFATKTTKYTGANLWKKDNVVSTSKALDVVVPAHDVLVYRFKKN
ncbi:glycoside hydrolase family 27 protein [Rhizosphaericola mali]|nr:glycoside hydrolase family 27 protein [Rhizosphaericola mali]